MASRRADFYYDKAKKLWRKQVTIKGIRKVFSGKTKQDVMLKLVEYQNGVTSCPFFRDVADEWEEQHWTEIRQGSWRSYNAPLRRIVERFGASRMDSITPKHVQTFLNQLGKDYSAKTVSQHKNIISMIYRFAIVEKDLDLTNPAEHVTVPAGLRKTTRTALTPEQKRIIADPENSRSFVLPFLIYWTGCRCGEALALQLQDVDFKEKTIAITKSVAHNGNQPTIGAPKTKNAYRFIPLLPPLEKRLREAKMKPTDYICTGEETTLTKSALDKRWKKWCAEHGLTDPAGKPAVDRHTIRHQYATTLYEAGIEAKSAQHLLGHADIKTTMEIYTHISRNQFQKDAEKLAAYVSEQ